MAIIIFDLDGTVIDTSHRYRNKPCGNIDLDFWFANSTSEKIALDKVLPLALPMRSFYSEGHTIVICTARDFSKLNGCDLGAVYRQFLADNDLPYHTLLYRNLAGSDHESYGDGELKTKLLTDYAHSQGFASIAAMGAIMFDDNIKVIQEMTRQRLVCLDAISYNRQLAKGKGIGQSIFDRAEKWRIAA